MKKLLLFAICSIFYCSYAQLPPNSFGEDFTLTDINGNEFNLHSTLDEGKTVILDLFAVWCVGSVNERAYHRRMYVLYHRHLAHDSFVRSRSDLGWSKPWSNEQALGVVCVVAN